MSGAQPRRRRPPLRSASDLTDRLRQSARRVTGPRRAILETLRTQARPLTIREVARQMRRSQCDLATIYRSIHLLEELGVVERVNFGDGRARFEMAGGTAGGHHHHLICTACSGVVEIEDCCAEQFESIVAAKSGFKAVSHRLEFFGICPQCQ